MPAIKINKSNLDKLEPPTARKDGGKGEVLHWDTEVKGFGARITATGKISFIIQRDVNGRDERSTIGTFGVMTPEQARQRAKELLLKQQDGISINREKKRRGNAGSTLSAVFEDYLSRKELREKTQTIYRAAFKNYLADWGALALADIDGYMVEAKYKKVRDAHGKASASQAIRLVSALFNHAIYSMELCIKANPVTRLGHVVRGWSKVDRRQTALLENDLRPFWLALQQLKNQTAKDYLLFLLLTGLRRSEAACLEWNEVDLSHALVTIPKEKNKSGRPFMLPLSTASLELLKRRRRVDPSGRFVFPSSAGTLGFYIECKTAMNSVAKKMGRKLTPHDLRRSMATAATKLGINTITLKQLLNHSTTSEITSGYVVSDADALREPVEKISGYLLGCMNATV